MDGDELRAAQRSLGLSDRDMLMALRMNGKSARVHLREMKDGKREIKGPIEVAVLMMLKHGLPDNEDNGDGQRSAESE